MEKQARIKALSSLGKRLNWETNNLKDVVSNAYLKNNWFTEPNVHQCLSNWSRCLTEDLLENWLSDVPTTNNKITEIGIIMAGNIPLVGLHDLLCVLSTGHKAKIKLSHNDEVLMKFVVNQLIEESQLSNYLLRNRYCV